MPARRLRPKCRHVCALIAVLLFLPVGVEAQTARSFVTLTASVSETVALSIPPNSRHGNVAMDVVSGGNTVRLTLSGKGANSGVVRVPLFVRSNIGFKISASAESQTARLTQFSVLEVRATGNLVSPEATNNLEISPQFDRRRLKESVTTEDGASVPDLTSPVVVLSGPRVSLGGTLDSSNNALEITLLLRVKSESVRGWTVHLTFFNH